MRFLTQGFLSKDRFDSLASMNEPQPKLTFFRFLAANPKTHQPVFIAQRLIGLDAIYCHRARRPHQLLYILDIRDRPRKPTPEKSPLLSEQRRPFLEILRLSTIRFLWRLELWDLGF